LAPIRRSLILHRATLPPSPPSTGDDNDRLGQHAKFCSPTVANGKVYVPTFQQEAVLHDNTHVKATGGDQPALVIYGLR
jgi:hypothetical protein